MPYRRSCRHPAPCNEPKGWKPYKTRSGRVCCRKSRKSRRASKRQRHSAAYWNRRRMCPFVRK